MISWLNHAAVPRHLAVRIINAATPKVMNATALEIMDALREKAITFDPAIAIDIVNEAKQAKAIGAAAWAIQHGVDVLTVKPLSTFLRERSVIEYVVDDVLVRGFLYAMTGATGAGKTAVAVPLTLTISDGRRFGKHETQKGSAIYIAGENPADVRMRFQVAVQEMGLGLDALNVHVLDSSFILADRGDELLAVVDALEAILVVVDTDQAVSLGNGTEENDNADRMVHAKRLRELTRAKSRPVVLDLCHPRKNAGRDDLTPRGGSSFLNEIDGNLCLWRDGDHVELFSDPNKYRGAPVALTFRKTLVESEAVKDAKGRRIGVPFYKLVSDDEADRARKEDWSDENRLLWAMHGEPLATQGDWAKACCWLTKEGEPRKDRVNRLLKRLEGSKLVRQSRSGRWTLTEAGKKEAQRP